MKKIFILGTSRTGSKFYMQLLNTHEDIYICPELIFRHPIKKDFYKFISKQIESDLTPAELAKCVLQFKERVPFTKTVTSIGEQRLKEKISTLEKLTAESIFETIIDLAASIKDKHISGAKFPVHPLYTDYIMNQFEDSKVLFLTRDPRAIFISDYKKKKRESKGSFYRFPIRGTLLRPIVLIYAVREWKQSLKYYEESLANFGKDRLELYKYEDVINDQKGVLSKIAKFTNIRLEELNANKVEIADSSYQKGISSDRWRKEISWLESFMINLFSGKKMKKYGYR